MRIVERLLYGLGYLLAPALFLGADTPAAVASRLRLAYRAVGVRIRDHTADGGVERIVFRCPYRGIGASRWGETWLCHTKLDRVDDGYVSFLARHRGVEYRRPRDCATEGACPHGLCYSEVRPADD